VQAEMPLQLAVRDETRVRIETEMDIVIARQQGRQLAATRGFSSTEQTLIATAISEVARNILEYAITGEIILRLDEKGDRRGIEVLALDEGPGIADIELAMRDGYSTAKSLGMGLPGARRLMDEFDVVSAVGRGTRITMKKWVR